jgi:hypothetical protein
MAPSSKTGSRPTFQSLNMMISDLGERELPTDAETGLYK